MNLQHSSGQRIDCKVEVILRDDTPDRGSGGDLLICEVDGTGRWLLFPPVAFRRVSARNGSLKGEIVVMIRGYHGHGTEWQELLILHNGDEQVGFEWVQMLGLTPVPPDIVRRPSFTVTDDLPLHPPSPSFLPGGQPQSPGKSRTPSPREIEVPIGEHASPTSKRAGNGEIDMPIRECTRKHMEPVEEEPAEEDADSAVSFADADNPNRRHDIPIHSLSLDETPKKHESSPPVQEDPPASLVSREPSRTMKDTSISPPSRKTSRQPEYSPEPIYRPPRDLNEAMMMAGGRSPPSALKRSKAKRLSRYDNDLPTKRVSSKSPQHLDEGPRTRSPTAHRPGQKVADRSPSPTARRPSKKIADRAHSPARGTPIASSKIRVSRGEEVTVSFPAQASGRVERPSSRDRQLTHGEEEEHISSPRVSTTPRRETSPKSSEEESPCDDPPIVKRRSPAALPALDLPTIIKTRRTAPITPPRSPSRLSSEEAVLGSPVSLTNQDRGSSTISQESLRERVPESPTKSESSQGDAAPPPPPHSPSPAQLKGSKPPVLFGHPSSAHQAGGRRRSSSPLKHEYEPSSATSSATSESEESEDSPAEEHHEPSFSDSSEEEELEDGDAPTPLLPLAALRALGKASPHGSIYSLPNGNFSPTQQTHQAGPQKPVKTFRAIASVFSWSEKGAWEPLHLHECSIAVTPGLIEAFQMSEAPTSPSDTDSNGGNAQQPLVALELTPLVPLRRGTALDISIRSPPMGESKIKAGNNIMFRSRSPEECEALYGAINTSRINNPKYIALQNAIPQHDGLNSFMDRRNSVRGVSSIWGWGSNKSSYRASGVMAPSIASSESSIGSFTSAFSALKRFGNGGRLFNISKSTISSRNGSRTGSTTTSSSGTSSNFGDGSSGGNGAITPPVTEDPNKGSPIGLSNTKIRLYCRETASKWRDMGSARLTIMRPSIGHKPSPQNHHHHHDEKRILVTSKVANAPPLLDVCLSESCFERVARTGIALSVWEERIGENGEVENIPAQGGVGGKTRVYMIQVCIFFTIPPL
jgi:hypothetical protein